MSAHQHLNSLSEQIKTDVHTAVTDEFQVNITRLRNALIATKDILSKARRDLEYTNELLQKLKTDTATEPDEEDEEDELDPHFRPSSGRPFTPLVTNTPCDDALYHYAKGLIQANAKLLGVSDPDLAKTLFE